MRDENKPYKNYGWEYEITKKLEELKRRKQDEN